MVIQKDTETILVTLRDIIRETFMDPDTEISRETTAFDVRGWTSLGHALLISAIESHYGVRLPKERIFSLKNVGELCDLIAQNNTL